MKKIRIKINKSVYLGLPILEISEKLMNEFSYDYTKPKYQNNEKISDMDTDSFIILIKSKDVYENIEGYVQKRSDTSNYEDNRLLLTEKSKKVMGLMIDELGGKILTMFPALRPKTYSYLMNDVNNNTNATKVDEKARIKGTKRCVIKRIRKFNDYKDCLFKNEIILTLQNKDLTGKPIIYAEKKLKRSH